MLAPPSLAVALAEAKAAALLALASYTVVLADARPAALLAHASGNNESIAISCLPNIKDLIMISYVSQLFQVNRRQWLPPTRIVTVTTYRERLYGLKTLLIMVLTAQFYCSKNLHLTEKGLVYIYCLLYLGCCLALGGFQGRQQARRL